jgi:DNA polymerase-4
MRASHSAGRTVTVRVRFTGLRSVTRSVTLAAPISATLTLADVGVELAGVALADHPGEREITLLAISVSNLGDERALQLELPLGVGDRHRPGSIAGSARWAIDRAVDDVRQRFGREAVGYAAVSLSDLGGVPDAFRELAEAGHDNDHK